MSMLTSVMESRFSFPKFVWIPFEKRTRFQHPVRRSISENCACRFGCMVYLLNTYQDVSFIDYIWQAVRSKQNSAVRRGKCSLFFPTRISSLHTADADP